LHILIVPIWFVKDSSIKHIIHYIAQNLLYLCSMVNKEIE